MDTTPSTPLETLSRLLSAAVGVFAIHQVAYLVAHPSTVGRAVAADGHGYLTPAAAVVLPAAAAVAFWVVVCRMAGTAPGSTRRSIARAGDYMALFAVQEVLERVIEGEPAASALSEPAVWLGLLLAPGLAVAGRWIAGRIDEAAVTIAIPVVVPPAPVLGAVALDAPALVRRSLAPTVDRVRGPPRRLR